MRKPCCYLAAVMPSVRLPTQMSNSDSWVENGRLRHCIIGIHILNMASHRKTKIITADVIHFYITSAKQHRFLRKP